ncbi:conserved Plasmodium protein, unknown function [Plasmodium relictum]|uniref:Uncharacterized protein n=1 Tax=Plasmodium relictum TaxID=85471 RepID=A0A1J1H200_PLARL|nr:conserved Plasmodium protein, unknown function [Plasmodium relictum]CRG98685.1 conserved Plasmodium protein, unknown function [Plasmodium relictum]
MANNSLYNLLIEKKKVNILKDNFDLTSLNDNEKYKINLIPEHVQGYYGCKNNLLKFAYKKIIYSYNNLIIIYDLFNQNQSIFSYHKNKVIFIRCKENCRTILSAEESRDRIKIYLWNKSNLKILTQIKIKKENFLDIDFLNDKNILLLCKYYDKLIFFVFFVVYKKKKTLLKRKYVNAIKKLDDFHLKKKRNDIKNDDNLFMNLNKLIIKKSQKYNSCNIFNKKDEKYIRNGTYSIVNEIKKKKKTFRNYIKCKSFYSLPKKNKKLKKKLFKKIYYKKVNGEALSYIKIKKYKKDDIFFYYISFLKPFKKCKKSYNVLLRNFKIFVDINRIVCIYNEEYIFTYLLKNYILYEKLRYKSFRCNYYLDNNTFSLIKRDHSFFSIFHFHLFIKKLILNRHFCFKDDATLTYENYFEDTHLKRNEEKKKVDENAKKIKEIEEEKKNKKEFGEKCRDIENELNIENISNNSSYNYISKHINDYFNNFINDEINVVEIITFVYAKENNDMDIIFNLQKIIEKKIKKRHYENLIKKKKEKNDSENKKFVVVGTKKGIIIIIDFIEPHKIVHLEKICNDNIASIFIFQNNILILNSFGILFFMNVHNFRVYKSIDIFEKHNKIDSFFLSNNNILDYGLSSNILEKKLNSFRIYKSNKNSSINNKVFRPKSGDAYKNKENSIIFYCEEKKSNHNNLFEDSLKKINFNITENKYINSSCLLDIYILVLGTSDNELIIYDLINNEICFIYKKSYRINYFILENDHIIYNIENSLYKMNLINFNSFKLLTLAKINISAFVFYSHNILICGTLKGNLYFFDISNNNVKVINKIEGKNFVQKKFFHNNSRRNEVQIIFSIKKIIDKKFVRKSNNIEKEVFNDKIIGLVLNKSKNFLLCSLKHSIFLFKLNISGNEKIDLKCVRYLNINNIIHINLLKNFDNLFYIATKENNNSYIYHLCSFNSSKTKNNKMDCIYFNILYENTWLCEFFYYNSENFILTENILDKKKNRCILLLDSFAFIIYSYTINRTDNFSSCNNLNCLIENKTSNEKNDMIYENKNPHIDIQRKNNFSNEKRKSNTLTNEKKYDIEENNFLRNIRNVNSRIHTCLKKNKTKNIPNKKIQLKTNLINKIKEKGKEKEEKEREKGNEKEKEKKERKREEGKRKSKMKKVKEIKEDKRKQVKRVKEKKNKNNEKKINHIKEKLNKEHRSKETKEIKERKKDENEKKKVKKTYSFINLYNQPKVKKLNIKEISSCSLSKAKKKNCIQDNGNNIAIQKKVFKSNLKLKDRILLKEILKSRKEDDILIRNQVNAHEKKKISYIKYKLLKSILQKKNVEFSNYKKLINGSHYDEKEKSYEIKECNYKENTKKVLFLSLDQKNKDKINSYETNNKYDKEVFIYDQYQNDSESICKDADKDNNLKKNNKSNYIMDYLKKYLSTNILKESELDQKKNTTKNYVNNASIIKRYANGCFISYESNISNIATHTNDNKNNIISNEGKAFYPKNELDKVNIGKNENFIKKEVNEIISCVNNSDGGNNYKSNNYESSKYAFNYENNIYNDNYIYHSYDDRITYIKNNYFYKNNLYFNNDNNENNKNNNYRCNYLPYNNKGENNNQKKSNYSDKKYQNNYFNANNFGSKKYINETSNLRYDNKVNYGKFISNRISYKDNTYLKRNNEMNSIFNLYNDKISKNTHLKNSYDGNMKYMKYNIVSLNVVKKCNENSINTNHINGRFSILNNNSKKKSMNTSFANDSNTNFYKNK